MEHLPRKQRRNSCGCVVESHLAINHSEDVDAHIPDANSSQEYSTDSTLYSTSQQGVSTYGERPSGNTDMTTISSLGKVHFHVRLEIFLRNGKWVAGWGAESVQVVPMK